MTLYQFKTLDKGHKIEVVCHDGIRLLERTVGHFIITLYQIECFYVELYFDNKLMQITKLHAFNTTISLEPYLKQIDISFLFQDSPE